MRINWHTTLAGLLWLLASGAALADDDARVRALSDRIEALPDATYIGGMGPDMQGIALEARQLAQAQLRRPLSTCPPFDPMRGTLVSEKAGARKAGIPELTVVQMLAAHLNAPRAVVRDTAAYVLGEIGPDARDALEGKTFGFDTWTPWQAHAGSRLRCERLSLGDALRVIPETVAEGWLEAHEAVMPEPSEAQMQTLMAELALRDPTLRWPEGLFLEWLEEVEKGDKLPADTMRKLGEVIADPNRPSGLRSDVARLVGQWRSEASPAVPGLRQAMTSDDEHLAAAAADALLGVGGDVGIEGAVWLLGHDVSLDFYQIELCELGPVSASRLAPRYVAALTSSHWAHAEAAAELLGCVQATDAVGSLVAALDRPVWRIQAAAARTLRKLAADQPDVASRLAEMERTHWSGLVRRAAAVPLPPDPSENALDLLRCFGRCAVDHGNHNCAGADTRDGIYVIDGKRFPVTWQRARRQPLPQGFPIELRQDSREDYGTNTFLRVPGGWLYGTDRWHYDGEFSFVTDKGVRLPLPAYGSEPAFLAALPKFGRISLGRAIFMAEDAGVLSLLQQDASGSWTIEPRIALPAVPHAWAEGPDGQLLVADPDNAVAVWPTGRIANLECPK